ncbi:MAG TPA: CARDB domain-containing protein, partial [Candidatus Pacearchaeota archaeon]|nr:CARDB domain-containing protein [Candidatus Pacearchaeota archaeon]
MNLKTFKNFLFCLSFLGILIVNGNVLATPDLPDLVVTNIFNNCSYNTIGVTVCNQGSNTNNMFRIAIKSNNHSMASGFVSISINNPCITYSFFSSSLGININNSYTATATADPLTGGIDMVKESDENNNTLTKIVQGCSSALSSVNAQCGSANGQSFNSA